MGGGQFGACGDEDYIEEIFGDGEIEIGGGGAAIGEADADVEDGVFEQAGLDEIGLGDAEGFEGGLEMAVVQQGDLDGLVYGQVVS